jgi:hypothetical protein
MKRFLTSVAALMMLVGVAGVASAKVEKVRESMKPARNLRALPAGNQRAIGMLMDVQRLRQEGFLFKLANGQKLEAKQPIIEMQIIDRAGKMVENLDMAGFSQSMKLRALRRMMERRKGKMSELVLEAGKDNKKGCILMVRAR